MLNTVATRLRIVFVKIKKMYFAWGIKTKHRKETSVGKMHQQYTTDFNLVT